MAETIYVRGEGGAILAMDLPLPEGIEQRVEQGLIRRVNADGSPYASTDRAPGASGSALTQGVSPRPAKAAPKSEWVTWACAVHGYSPQEADALSKAALQDLPDLPDLPEQQPQQPATGRPAEDADKSEWIAYVVRLGKLSAEDAENYTKDDLIDLAS